MSTKNRHALMTAVVLTTFMFSAVWTVPALAEDGAPPPPVDNPAEIAPPTDGAPTDVPPADLAVDAVAPSNSSSLPELLGQPPEGTDVVVTDTDGSPIPLATKQAAEAIAGSDPIWCPAGVAVPVSGGMGCTLSSSSFEFFGLLFDLAALDPNKAGTIWIEKGYNDLFVGDVDVVLDGVVFTNMDNFALTIRGGWNGLGTGTADKTDPSEFDSTFSILNWNGAVTITDVAIYGSSNSASTTYGLDVETTKSILLDRVTVAESTNAGAGTMEGAFLANYAGGTGNGTVTVNNSSFNHNEGFGIYIDSNGIFSANNFVASRNGDFGAYINNISTLGDKSVTLKGTKQFSFNSGYGLEIFSDGLITISNMVATNNSGNGVMLNNKSSTANLGVVIAGTNSFLNNGSDGLRVESNGTITAANLNAANNGSNGVYLDNCDYAAGYCQSPLGKAVKITGYNSFTDNSSNGLEVESLGTISVSYLTASENSFNGALLNNLYLDNTVAHNRSAGALTITGYGMFYNNNGDGLAGLSYASFTGANLTASYNHGAATICQSLSGGGNGCGIYVDVFKTATLTGVNTFFGNTGSGLFISGNGKIAAGNTTATNNGKYGAFLYTGLAGAGVTLTGSNSFSSNASDGLNISANGAITVNNVTANWNTGAGANLQNDTDATKPYSITLKGNNVFIGSGGIGLSVDSYGAIAVNNLTSIASTGASGADLDNNQGGSTLTPKPVTLTGFANTSANFTNGLAVESLGAITVNNVFSNDNGGEGIYLNNHHDASRPMNVTVKGTNVANGNTGNGIYAFSYGSIALNNITANLNLLDGAYLDNSTGSLSPKNINLTGVNNFYDNHHDGLGFYASGSVILSRVNASYNDGFVDLYFGDGVNGTAGGSITLVCAQMVSNYDGSGFDLTAGTAVIIKGVYAYNNGASDIAFAPTVTLPPYPCALP